MKSRRKQDVLIGVCESCSKNLGAYFRGMECNCGGFGVVPMFKSEYDEITAHIKELKEKYPNDTKEEYIKKLIF